MTYEKWMEEVDNIVFEATQVIGVHDLVDCNSRIWYDDGCSPRDAAQMALENDDLAMSFAEVWEEYFD